jgi:FtsH-binding integral membrane protein
MTEFITHMLIFNLVVLIVATIASRIPRFNGEYFRISWVGAWYGVWLSGLYLLFGG